jgi:aminoglycoside phosphotransferase (APT) family kinase protein
VFAIQEHGNGYPISVVDDIAASAIVNANRLQEGCADKATTLIDYNERIRQLVSDDYDGWAAKVRAYSETAHELIDELLARVTDPHVMDGDDLVHGDYGRSNILIEDGEISAFVDVDNLGWGNRVGDLACIYRQMIVVGDPVSARQIIRHEIEKVAGPEGFYAGFAFRAISNLAWSIDATPQFMPRNLERLGTYIHSDEF